MELTTKLVSGSEVKGYVVNDSGETYPILLESLHSKVIFDGLVQSGYEFCGLPYDFRKDGVSIDQLPTQSYDVTPAEEQDMFDMLDADMYDNEELRARVVKAKVTLIPEPETNYTITTREDFIKFLNAFNPQFDFAPAMPVNSFVAPNARFTLEEYLDPKNHKYIQVLDSYRHFSFKRWVRFLEESGQDFKDYNSILRYYFQWGLDGLYFPVLSKSERNISTPIDAVFSGEDRVSALLSKKEIGLLDRNGTILLPENSRGLQWEPVYSRDYVESLKQSLKGNQTAVINLKAYVKEICLSFDSFSDTMQITTAGAYIGNFSYPSIVVYPNGLSNFAANPEYWPMSKLDDMADRAYMQALAKDTLISRVEPCTGTSARALDLLGCSKKGILNYVVTTIGADKESATSDGDSLKPITPNVINDYCDGKLESGAEKDFLDGILDGTYNIDAIHTAETVRAKYSIDSVYEQIYVMHRIFNIPIDTIREKILEMGENPSFTVTNSEGYEFTFEQPINRSAYKAFNTDVQSYRTKAATEASEYIYITQAIRELGSIEATRHVGFVGYTLPTYKSSVKILLDFIKEQFTAKVEEKCVYKAEQGQWLADADYFAATRAFEIAFKGTITFPSGLGGEVMQIEPNLVDLCKKQMSLCSDTLTAVTEANIDDNTFRYLFVNAYVTPTQVIPIKNAEIEQIDLSANWTDFRSMPAVYDKLLAKGAVKPNATPLELFAADPKFIVTCHNIGENTDLYSYYLQAQAYIKSVSPYEKFVAVPHPTEYLMPALYKNEEEEEEDLSPTPLREGTPKFSIAPIKKLKMEDFKDYLDISGEVGEADPIQPYFGMNSEDFYMIDSPIDALKKSVPLSNQCITVQLPDTLYIGQDGPLNYREVPKYVNDNSSIIGLWGRKYVLRDYTGNLYSVEV